jgi:GT2 family glycosyltransferase
MLRSRGSPLSRSAPAALRRRQRVNREREAERCLLQTSASAQTVTTPQGAAVMNGALAAPARRLDTINVAVVIVTWNRVDEVDGALRAVARQDIGAGRLDVIVVDNASSDGTTDRLGATWRPDRIYDNSTSAAHEPAFKLAEQRAETPDDAVGEQPASHHNGKPRSPAAGRCAHPFASLTIVRNTENLGGCGGFNTGLCAVGQWLDCADGPRRPDYVWLVDDDVDLAPDACRRLVEAAEADPGAGIIGSRAVDLHDRQTTFETTIYFDFNRGRMGDAPTSGHRLEQSHAVWLEQVGSSRGRGAYTGVLEVDVVSACSLLARWSAVREVGFWDKRYFIYCDDADWCLRFARSGWRVMLCLDAVVYHTPWFDKLTPARLYYSQRNIVWTLQKALSGPRLRYATFRWMAALMRESLQAAFRRRTFHADIIRRTALHIATNRGARFDDNGPPKVPVAEALRACGALAPGARIAVICPRPEFVEWADEIRLGAQAGPPLRGGSGSPSLRGGRHASDADSTSDPSQASEPNHEKQPRRGDPSLAPGAANPPRRTSKPGEGVDESSEPRRGEGGAAERSRHRAEGPDWIYLIRNDAIPPEMAEALDRSPPGTVGLPRPPRSEGLPIIYSHRLRSKLRRQFPLLARSPHAVIVFNQTSDFPLLRGRRNLHIDQRTRHLAQVEPDGLVTRAAFCARWLATAARVAWFLATLRRYRAMDRFG